jgi:glyoxylase-like metal-dependent hydrolase (beta-lactamase superfamily II)
VGSARLPHRHKCGDLSPPSASREVEPSLSFNLPARAAKQEKPTPELTYRIFDTGYCTVRENYLVTSGRHMRVPVHAIAVLLSHPTHGWFLFDTGYAPRILDATRGYPFRIYRWITPMTVTAELALVNQVGRFGIHPEDVSRIVLSHFHADHIAGLRDFPGATFVAGREAWMAVRELSSIRALARGFIPSLLPADFERRALFIDDFPGPAVPPFGASHDIFTDGSALLVRLPGHARGQLGLMAHTGGGRILFAADSYWTAASVRERALPHPITRYVVDDWLAVERTIHNIADFALANPEVTIIATHCPEAFRAFVAEPS